MRCSSCEALLDQYVEGWLEPARAAAVAAHLSGCSHCEALHRRLRNVDGLLATATRPKLRENFTDDLMEKVGTLPVPSRPSRPLLPLAAIYLAVAWIAVIGSMAAWRGAAAQLGAQAYSLASAFAALGESVRAFGPAEPIALLVVTIVLAIDLLLFAGVVVFYRRVRPRLHAYLGAVEAR